MKDKIPHHWTCDCIKCINKENRNQRFWDGG